MTGMIVTTVCELGRCYLRADDLYTVCNSFGRQSAWHPSFSDTSIGLQIHRVANELKYQMRRVGLTGASPNGILPNGNLIGTVDEIDN